MSSSSLSTLGQEIGPLYKVVVASFEENVGAAPTSNSTITQSQFGAILKGAWEDAYSQRATKQASKEWSRFEKRTVADLWKQAFRGGAVKKKLGFGDLLRLLIDGGGVPPTPEQKYGAQAKAGEGTDAFAPLERIVNLKFDEQVLTATAFRRVKVLESRCSSLIKLLKQSDDENHRLQKQLDSWASDEQAAGRLSTRNQNARLAELEEEQARFSAEKSDVVDLVRQNEQLKKALADTKAKCKKFSKLVKSKKGLSASAVTAMLQFEANMDKEEKAEQRRLAAEKREQAKQEVAARKAEAPTLSICSNNAVTITPAKAPPAQEEKEVEKVVQPPAAAPVAVAQQPAPRAPSPEPARAASKGPATPQKPQPVAAKAATPEPAQEPEVDPFAAPPPAYGNSWGTPIKMPQSAFAPEPVAQEENYETNPGQLFGAPSAAAFAAAQFPPNAVQFPPVAQRNVAPAPALQPAQPMFQPQAIAVAAPVALPEPVRKAGGPRKPPMRVAGSTPSNDASEPIPEPAEAEAAEPKKESEVASEEMPGPPPVVSTPYPVGIAAPPGLFSGFGGPPFASAGGFPASLGNPMSFGSSGPFPAVSSVNPIAPPSTAFQQQSSQRNQPQFLVPGGNAMGLYSTPMMPAQILPIGSQPVGQFANAPQSFVTISPTNTSGATQPPAQWQNAPAQKQPAPQPIASKQAQSEPAATSAPEEQSYSAPVRAQAASKPRSPARPPMKGSPRKPQPVAPVQSTRTVSSWASMIGSRPAPPGGSFAKSAAQNGTAQAQDAGRRPPKRTTQGGFSTSNSWADQQESMGDNSAGLWDLPFPTPTYDNGQSSSRPGQRGPIARGS